MKKFMQALFVPPNDTLEEHNLPSRLTDEIFKKLNDAKINMLFGYGFDGRHSTIVKTLELCEKYDIDYLLQVPVSDEYLSTKYNRYKTKPYIDLSEEEIKDLDNRFVEFIKKYTKYKAMKGIIFEDECGYLCYPGVLHAKEVFEKHFPDLLFYTNFFSYTINDTMFWNAFMDVETPIVKEELPFQLEGKYAVTFENRFNYYELLIDGLAKNSHFEYLTCDKYPYEVYWEECPRFMHISYLDSVAFFTYKKHQYNSKTFSYLQVGQWFLADKRPMTRGEYELLYGIQLLYGTDGFSYFPAFYPVDFVVQKDKLPNSDNGEAALFDINGKTTKFYDWSKEINNFLDTISDDYLASKFIGVKSYGEYYNDFDFEVAMKHSDSEVIYRGELPPYYLMDKQDLTVNNTSNNVVISVFEKGDKHRYVFVNMSSMRNNEIDVALPNSKYQICRIAGNSNSTGLIKLTMNPGEMIYIIEK